MSALPLGMALDLVIAILLVLAIGTSLALDGKLRRFQADEKVLKATIAELTAATSLAERAVQGLKAAVAEADKTLGVRLEEADAAARALANLVEARERVRVPLAPRASEIQQARSSTLQRPAFAARSG